MTDDDALERYLSGVGKADAVTEALVRELDAAIRGAYAGFDVDVKYRMLMYSIGKRWREWVCAIGLTNKGVALRFLWGVLLSDPRKVLRPGSSVLMTWDYFPGDVVDAEAVGGYVSEAVARYDEYRANAKEIQDRAHAAAAQRKRSRG